MESTCDELTAKQKVQLLAKNVDRAKAAVSETIEDGKLAAERLLKRGQYAIEDTVEQRIHDIRVAAWCDLDQMTGRALGRSSGCSKDPGGAAMQRDPRPGVDRVV